MLRIYLFLLLGAIPLSAQTAVDDADKLKPAPTPEIVPANPPANETLTPGIDAPPTTTPQPDLPAEPIKALKLVDFTISPGIIREGLTDKNAIKATVTLSEPATKAFLCHIESSDKQKVVCGDILVPKGQQQQDGIVTINWMKVLHDCQVTIKAYEDEDPETYFHARVYLRKKLE